MRIGIVSDTHGDSYAIRRVIEQAGRVDAWICLLYTSDAADE